MSSDEHTRRTRAPRSSSSESHRAVTPKTPVSMPVAGWVSVIITAAVVGGSIILAFDRLNRVEAETAANTANMTTVKDNQKDNGYKRENIEGAINGLSERVGGLEAKFEDLDDAVREAIKPKRHR